MNIIAAQHLKEEYGIDFVVDRYKFLPRHVGPDISFYGHSKEDADIEYIVRIDYEDKVVKFVWHYDPKDQ